MQIDLHSPMSFEFWADAPIGFLLDTDQSYIKIVKLIHKTQFYAIATAQYVKNEEALHRSYENFFREDDPIKFILMTRPKNYSHKKKNAKVVLFDNYSKAKEWGDKHVEGAKDVLSFPSL